MRAIPERLRGVFTTRRYTNPRLPFTFSCAFGWWSIILLHCVDIATWQKPLISW